MTAPAIDPLVQPLTANLAQLRRRIQAAQARSPRAARAVELVVVTKSVPDSWLAPLAAAGATQVGENRVVGALERRARGPAGLRWHLVGHLQRNKALRALEAFDVFHALDSLRLATHLDRLQTERAGRPWPVLLQVNASGEDQKEGVAPEKALGLLGSLLALPRLLPIGFMTIARHCAEEAELRRTFRTLCDLRAEAQRRGLGDSPPSELSMGMSEDFEVAVEEGATIVRVGRAVFSGLTIPRNEAAAKERA